MSENDESDDIVGGVISILFLTFVIGYFFEGAIRVIALCIGGFMIIPSTVLIGGKIAGADEANFGMAVIATIATVFTNAISFSLMSSASLQSLAPLVGFTLEAFVVQGCFNTSFGKALVTVVMSWIILAILLVGLWFAFGKTLLPELMPLLLKLATIPNLQ